MALFPAIERFPASAANTDILRVRIADLNITIECHVPACRAAIGSLCDLYEKVDAPSALHFLIGIEGGDIRLDCNGATLWRGSDAGEIAAAFEYHLYCHVAKMLAGRFVSLHASALAAGGRAVLFAGASGAGKSSLATQGLLRGMDYLSDEFALLDMAGRVHPFPRPLQWGKARHPAFRHAEMLASGLFRKAGYSFPDRDGRRIHSLLWLPRRVVRQSQAIHALVLPRFSRQCASTELRPLYRSQAMMMLAHEIHQRGAGRQAIELLHACLPSAVPVFGLRYGDVSQAWGILQEAGLIPSG